MGRDERGSSAQRHGGRAAGAALAFALVTLLVAFALHWRNPAIAGRWPGPQAVFAVLDAAVLVATIVGARRSSRLWRVGVLALPVAAAVIAAEAEWRARRLRDVLSQPAATVRPAAAHVIAGFYDMDGARALATAGVAGLFLSPRNVRGRSAAAIARDVAALQALRSEVGLPPLWIAADQEGGLVATLSPPLPRPAPLAAHAGDVEAIATEARAVGRQLAALNVNVNFAPVVDVTRGVLDPADRNSRIASRSLSSDPAVVTRGADAYCRGLQSEGVQCTIKHFPGLGPVTIDTHVAAAHLATIDPIDLEPFRRLVAPGGPQPWVMLGHVSVDDRDPSRPASASPALIGFLRSTLRDGGVIVTDDAAMAPYRADLASHAVSTLRSGGDLILASWDPDVALAVIADIVHALKGDEALAAALAASDVRLGARLRAAPTPSAP